jgi:mono/diheme cytochrome c family protein
VFLNQDYYREHSPYQTWNSMRSAPFTTNLSDEQVWDLVAWIWQKNTSPAKLAEGGALYERDCAACHGVEGAGDGIFALTLNSSPIGKGEPESSDHAETGPDGHSLEVPTNFQNAKHLLDASPALLQGKILRGGMGTGMPSWGLVYTEEQTWALVDYLWTFIYQYTWE